MYIRRQEHFQKLKGSLSAASLHSTYYIIDLSFQFHFNSIIMYAIKNAVLTLLALTPLALTHPLNGSALPKRQATSANCVDPGEHQCAAVIWIDESSGSEYYDVVGGSCSSSLIYDDGKYNPSGYFAPTNQGNSYYGTIPLTYGTSLQMWASDISAPNTIDNVRLFYNPNWTWDWDCTYTNSNGVSVLP